MTALELWLLASICFLGMVSPGPDFILITRNAVMQPRAQALATAFGIVAGCTIHAAYCILGLAFVITKSVMAYNVIKYLGAAYLVYIGVKSIFAKKENAEIASVPQQHLSIPGAFMQGFLCNVLNPKLAVFLLSLFTQFISPDAGLGQKAIVAGVFFVESAIYWPLLVLALQLPLVRQALRSVQHIVNRLCGAVLIMLGARVALSH